MKITLSWEIIYDKEKCSQNWNSRLSYVAVENQMTWLQAENISTPESSIFFSYVQVSDKYF